MKHGAAERIAGVSANAQGTESGLTLLEAYSALASRNRSEAIDIPFPGQPASGDLHGRFWTIRVGNGGY